MRVKGRKLYFTTIKIKEKRRIKVKTTTKKQQQQTTQVFNCDDKLGYLETAVTIAAYLPFLLNFFLWHN